MYGELDSRRREPEHQARQRHVDARVGDPRQPRPGQPPPLLGRGKEVEQRPLGDDQQARQHHGPVAPAIGQPSHRRADREFADARHAPQRKHPEQRDPQHLLGISVMGRLRHAVEEREPAAEHHEPPEPPVAKRRQRGRKRRPGLHDSARRHARQPRQRHHGHHHEHARRTRREWRGRSSGAGRGTCPATPTRTAPAASIARGLARHHPTLAPPEKPAANPPRNQVGQPRPERHGRQVLQQMVDAPEHHERDHGGAARGQEPRHADPGHRQEHRRRPPETPPTQNRLRSPSRAIIAGAASRSTPTRLGIARMKLTPSAMPPVSKSIAR